MKTRQLVLCAMMVAILAISAQIAIPLGPVPFTMSIFAVVLVGALLPPVSTAACLFTYLFLGLVGIPVFAGFKGGPPVLFGPTGGYLIGYFLLALAASLAVHKNLPSVFTFFLSLLGLAGCYLLGTLWYVVSSGASFWTGLALCVFPFAIPDMIKAALASALAAVLRRNLFSGRFAQ